MKIREASITDSEQIRKVYLAAFDDSERALVSSLAIDLLSEKSSPNPLHLLAEQSDKVVGHISFSPVVSQNQVIGSILAPLAVNPDYQKRGIGSQLIRKGIEILGNQKAKTIFVYGDPDYYGRFGFQAETAKSFIPPYTLQYPFGWQALALQEGFQDSTSVRIECVHPLNKPELW